MPILAGEFTPLLTEERQTLLTVHTRKEVHSNSFFTAASFTDSSDAYCLIPITIQ